MKEIIINLVYADIAETIITYPEKNLVIKYKNGDRLTLKPSDYTTRLRNHLKKTFNGEHLG